MTAHSQYQQLDEARILIADEATANLRWLETLLGTRGYLHLRSTTDAREAVAICREEPQDLLLLDMRMPQLDGLEVMSRIRHPDLADSPPVLVMTDQADLATRLRALEAGARDFIGKPFERTEVLSRIRNALEVRLMYNRLCAQNELLEDAVRARTRELVDSRLEVIWRLGRAAEYGAEQTGRHLVRMSTIAALLAAARGLSDNQCELIRHASPLHDIGQIAIPDAISLKPGSLSAEDWRIMRTHTTIGAEILSGHHSVLMRTASHIALGHHERWDGSGYPHGVKGEAIPLAARICAVADTFDSLTSMRPYRNARSPQEAIVEIDRLAGKQLDPSLVRSLHEILPEAVRVKENHADPVALYHSQAAEA